MSFLVKIRNADVYVGGGKILKSLTWSMGEKENWAIIGNNGSGKTTLMKLIFGEHIPVYGGVVQWFGNKERMPLSEVREKIGYVSAEYQRVMIALRSDGKWWLLGIFLPSVCMKRLLQNKKRQSSILWITSASDI